MRSSSTPRRRRRPAWLVLVGIGAVSAPASAQGLLESLFGIGNAPRSARSSRPPNQASFGYRTPLYYPDRERRHERDQMQREARTGNYRTLCVRMCDGYYFPISEAARRSSFYDDAKICRARCGEDARLFFYAVKSEEPADMVDVSGRAYTSLPTAFLYRKQYVSGCKCKPDPWTQSELARHQAYALAERTQQEDPPANDPPAPEEGESRRAPGHSRFAGAGMADGPLELRGDASGARRSGDLAPAVGESNVDLAPTQVSPVPEGIVPPSPRPATRPPGRAEARMERRRRRIDSNVAAARTRSTVRRASAKGSGVPFNGSGSLRWPGD